jgi:hypothetical protein
MSTYECSERESLGAAAALWCTCGGRGVYVGAWGHLFSDIILWCAREVSSSCLLGVVKRVHFASVGISGHGHGACGMWAWGGDRRRYRKRPGGGWGGCSADACGCAVVGSAQNCVAPAGGVRRPAAAERDHRDRLSCCSTGCCCAGCVQVRLGGDMVKIDLRAIQHYKAQDERV